MLSYEIFVDPACFDMWAVRRVGDKDFNNAIHVLTEGEALEVLEELRNLDIMLDKCIVDSHDTLEIMNHNKELVEKSLQYHKNNGTISDYKIYSNADSITCIIQKIKPIEHINMTLNL